MMDESKPMLNPELLAVLLQKGGAPVGIAWRRDTHRKCFTTQRENASFHGDPVEKICCIFAGDVI